MPTHQHLPEPATTTSAQKSAAVQPKAGGPLADRTAPSNTGSLFQAQVATNGLWNFEVCLWQQGWC